MVVLRGSDKGQKNVFKNEVPSLTEVKFGSLERESCQQTPLLKSVLDIENLIVRHRNLFCQIIFIYLTVRNLYKRHKKLVLQFGFSGIS
jgi:hypothetical protein